MEDYCKLRSVDFQPYQAELLEVAPLLSGVTGPWLGHNESHSETSQRVQSQSQSENALGISLSWGHSDGNRHGGSLLRTIL